MRVGFALLLAAFVMPSGAYEADAQEHCISCSEPDAQYSCIVQSNGTLPPEAASRLHCIKELARRAGHRTCSVRRQSAESGCAGERVVLALPSLNQPDVAATQPGPLPSGAPSEVIGSDGRSVGVVAPPPVYRETTRREDDRGAPMQSQPTRGDDLLEDPAVSPRKDRPPQTVQELAEKAAEDSKKGVNKAGKFVVDTAKSTGKQIEKAGEAVGGAAKKTWDCVVSLFSKC